MTITPQAAHSNIDASSLSLKSLRAVVDDLDCGFMVESDEEIAYVNRAYVAFLGYDDPAELIGCPVSAIISEEDAGRLLGFGKLRATSEEAPRSYAFAARRRDDSTLPLQASVSTSYVAGSLVIATVVRPTLNAAATDTLVSQSGDKTTPLSPRENEVMYMILAGKRMKEIAFTLQLSPKTVSTHRHRILSKLRLTDNRDLFQYALRHRLIDWG